MTWRDARCGELRAGDVGRTATVAGWVARRRDHGGLVFVDLRDSTGLMQLVINPERSAAAADLAKEIRNEFVLQARGAVVARSPETVNSKMATGDVEVLVDELDIVSRSTPLPFQLEEEGVDETLRLRYRWLDLRTERMQRNLRLRSTVVAAIRRSMEEQGFLDVWTPGLTLGTPEGARDFLVPVRLQPGTFFALAQSPQLFKQALAIGGLDRYYQIATCWRDEDLRADRQFEFRQLDLELAFPTRDEVLEVLERVVVASFEALDREPPERPFPRLSYADAMLKYGSDKPDLRFGLEIQDATEMTRGSEFGVFAGASVVRFLVVPQELSRGDLAKLETIAKEWGAKGLAYLVFGADGEVRSPIAKFLSQEELDAFAAPPASTVLFAADEQPAVERVLGALRLHLGREVDLVDEERDAFHWILDFPLFQLDDETGRWTFVHHPFTGPLDGHEELIESDPASALSQHYDLIWNGWELGSGSIRIHRPDVQERVFRAMGMSEAEAQAKFGWFLHALQMGAPPHGGFALGLDRFVALLAGEPNIRQVIAFPKVSSGSDPLTGAPSPVPADQLAELGIRVLDDGSQPKATEARYARVAAQEGGGPVGHEHDLPLEEYHRAGGEITNGNPEIYKSLYSRRDDVTLANPFGPPARGWSEVSATLDRAAANYRDGEVVGFENVSTVITADLAYIVEIERYRARVGGAEEMTPVAVRVTTVFRREDAAWKVVHRHGDPITTARPPESVVQA